MINSLFICSNIGASLPCYALVKYTVRRSGIFISIGDLASTQQPIDTMVKTRIGAVGPWALLALVLLLAGSCACVQAAGEQKNGGGRRRRTHRRSAAAVAGMMVPITFLNASVEKGAVCMDGTPAAYHLDPGSGAGNKSWIVNLEGGGWCNNARTCKFRTRSRHGSSNFMERQIAFTGIMSASPADNPGPPLSPPPTHSVRSTQRD